MRKFTKIYLLCWLIGCVNCLDKNVLKFQIDFNDLFSKNVTESRGQDDIGFSSYNDEKEEIQTFNAQLEKAGYTKPDLKLDEAWLTINSSVNYDIVIYSQTDECYKCELVQVANMSSNATIFTMIVNTKYKTLLQLVRNLNGEILCSFNKKFREKGDYWTFVNEPPPGNEHSCHLILANDPMRQELAILYVILGLLGLAVKYAIGKQIYKYFRKITAHRRSSMDITSAPERQNSTGVNNGQAAKHGGKLTEDKPEEKKKPRLQSLDTFRGLSLTLMIFVNYGGGRYWFFDHAAWNGYYVADLVFPWFVFIMGVSMNFSFRSMFRQQWSVPRIAWKIVWRAIQLFGLGFMLGTVHYQAHLQNVRIFGVLQRLACTYLISALIHFCCVRRFDSHQERKWAAVRDILLYVPEWLANLAVLGLYFGLLYGLPVPGCPTGYIGPGGLSEGGKFQNCTGGAARYVDYLIMGDQHMYQHPTPKEIYKTTVAFDPEGVLATLSCVFLCFLGIQAGRIILIYQDHKGRIIRFMIWAVILGSLSALLTKCSKNDGWIPANKNIWSISYSLISATFGYTLLTLLYVIIDILNLWSGQPFKYPGMNSIVIFLCHSIFYQTFPISFYIHDPEHWQLLLLTTWGTSVWVLVAYWLYWKKLFIAL